MALYRTQKVAEIIEEHPDVIKFKLDDNSRAYIFPMLNGTVKVGDEVVINTTAVDLALGTGGWHFALWNLSNSNVDSPRGGHIMKMRYTPVQLDSGVAEEFEDYPNEDKVDLLDVIAAPLHSHIPAIVTLIKNRNPQFSIAVLISDGAALPVALSDTLRDMKHRKLVDKTISFGHSFGADIEALNVYTALLSAKHIAKCDVAIVSMGPGIVGTNTKYGFTGIEVANHLDVAQSLGAETFGVLRCSSADPRERHRGVSHHSLTTFGQATFKSHKLGYISDHELSKSMSEQLDTCQIKDRHDVKALKSCGIVDLMEDFDLNVTSMGTKAREDELFFESAAIAARLALGETE